jgi:hypothetical protein
LHLLSRGSLTSTLVDQNDSSFIAETSFVRAPLNSRVVSNANAPKVKGKGKQEPLDRVPLEIQEAMILEDLLFVLMVLLFSLSSRNGFNIRICRALKGRTSRFIRNILQRTMILYKASVSWYHPR